MSDATADPLQETLETLAELEARLPEFHGALMQMAGHLADRLHLPDAHLMAEDPSQFVPVLTDILRHDELEDEDRTWLLPRLCYIIGETICERLGPEAGWSVDRDVRSPSFARYVVGTDAVKVDPFGAAAEFLDQPPPREFGAWVAHFA